MNHSISVVLPNYNGRHLLEKNIPSLLTAINQFEHEIIVVDDCSTDDSVQYIAQTYPDIKIISNEVNMGFSATCNKGINAAGLELLCVVNTDVTFAPDYFSNMAQEFDDPTLFAIKGNIVNYRTSPEDVINIDRTTLLYYKRGFLRFDTKSPLKQRTMISNDDAQFVCLGCCFVCNRLMTLQLKGFDEIYSPFYWEDADLARRAMQHGFKLLYLPESVVYHQASSTIGNYRSSAQRKLVSYRNKFLFTWRHLDAGRFWLSHVPASLFNILFRWLLLDWKYYAALLWAITRELGFYRRST